MKKRILSVLVVIAIVIVSYAGFVSAGGQEPAGQAAGGTPVRITE